MQYHFKKDFVKYRLKSEYSYDFDMILDSPSIIIEGAEVAVIILKNGCITKIVKRIVHFSKKDGLYIIFENKIYSDMMFNIID